jgi:hypothetical protein
MLVRLMKHLKPGDAIASLGYPDVLFPPDKLAQALGDRAERLQYRPDSDKICARHGIQNRQIPDAESLFDLFGASLDVYDIVDERGCEIVLDLNFPFPANACEQYEWVLDVGTVEHCFNIAQAIVNVASLAKVGGTVIHENPFNCGNHGFYNLNPTLYHDFYAQNGFVVEECKLARRDGWVVSAPATKRFIYTESEINVHTVARRVEVKDMTFPMQTKYRSK